jgi:hypothetical protein
MAAQRGGEYALEAAIELPDVRGWLTQLALDRKSNRLYVAALGAGTVEVVDVQNRRHVRSLLGVLEPRGVAALSGRAKVWIASAASGELRLVDANSGRTDLKIPAGAEAGHLWLSADERVLYAALDAGLAAYDAASGRLLWRHELGGHPEHLVLDEAGGRVFVSVPDARRVLCLDLATRAVRWEATPRESATFPLVHDPLRDLLLVAARKPEKLLGYGASDGSRKSQLECAGSADAAHLDSARGRILVSCGDGTLCTYRAEGSGWLAHERIPTAAGARTSLYDAPNGRLYLAVPRQGEQRAEIRIYRAGR